MADAGKRLTSPRLLGYNERKLFIAFFALMVALVIENSYSQVADFVTEQIVSFWGIVLFVITSSIFIFGSFVILETVKAKNKETGTGQISMRAIELIITIIQYILTSIIVFVILQVLFTSQYNKDLLTVSYNISYLSSIFLTVLLAWKLFSWYKIQKKPIVLLFGLGAVFIVLASICAIIWSDVILLLKPSVVFPDSEVLFGVSDEDSEVNYQFDFVLQILYYFQTAFILLIWGGTILLLYHNFKWIGRVKFWVLVILPVVTFLSTLLTIYQEINPTGLVAQAFSSNLMIPILVLNYSGLAVGIIFGLSFILVGRFLKRGIHSRDYMIIAGLGFILFYWANGATLIQAAYPPYGIATVSAMPLALFMIVTGLYYSAVSVAQDITLRNSMRQSVTDMKFLEGIGMAQVEKEVQRRVSHLEIVFKEQRTELEKLSGVQSSIQGQDIKGYLLEVLHEVDKQKMVGK
jgi:hypothetical protein